MGSHYKAADKGPALLIMVFPSPEVMVALLNDDGVLQQQEGRPSSHFYTPFD